MGIETVVAFVVLALASAAGPVLTILIVSRVAGDFAQQLLKSVDQTGLRIIGHLNEHRMLGGKPKDLIDRELDLEQKRVDVEAHRQEQILQETLESRRHLEARDPFSGRITRE